MFVSCSQPRSRSFLPHVAFSAYKLAEENGGKKKKEKKSNKNLKQTVMCNVSLLRDGKMRCFMTFDAVLPTYRRTHAHSPKHANRVIFVLITCSFVACGRVSLCLLCHLESTQRQTAEMKSDGKINGTSIDCGNNNNQANVTTKNRPTNWCGRALSTHTHTGDTRPQRASEREK